ncbi:hypothetical protein [Pyrodictium abyssi]|uniref:HEPN domain-containing protein n=1 Tax=Pyrodictium abyssi TaxID=54256 RepID=A0ABM8IXJ0_9CREN|nr:hypothetical protein PABY_18140 [Pyrodictium abyssi]
MVPVSLLDTRLYWRSAHICLREARRLHDGEEEHGIALVMAGQSASLP